MNEVIHIVLASNESYYLGLFVTSVSLARHAREDLTLVFHVFDGGISDALFATYSESLSRAHAHVSVDRIRIDEDLFSKCPDFRGNKMAYARLLGPKMFLDVVWAVYCDVYVLWRADVAELVDQCKGSNASLWAVHVGLSKGNVESFEAQGLKVNPDRYFNSGVMVMNFDRLRTGDFMGEVVSILARHPELGLAEQNALNVLYSTKSSLEILDDSWNVRMFAVKNHAEIRCAKVLHYVASAPWNRGLWAYPFSPGSLQWFKELSRIKGVGLIRCACEVLTIWCLLSKLILTGVDRIPLLRKVPRWIRGG